MKLKLKKRLSTKWPQGVVTVIPVRDMKDRQFAVVVDHAGAELLVSQFNLIGEIIYRDYAGWHGLTGDRFWPTKEPIYVPEMHVRLLEAGELLIVTE